jgi:predicted transcriptional regulator
LTERSRDDKVLQKCKKRKGQERKKMEYGKKFEAIQKASKLSVDEFVKMAGVSKRGYYYITTGEKEPRTLTKRRIDELAKEYGVKDHGDK